MLSAVQLVTAAVIPLKVTVLGPWVAPKFVPVMVTGVPPAPEIGERPVRSGVGPEVGETLARLIEVPTPLPAARKATICMIQAPPVTAAVALWLPAVLTI